ncbi:NAD-dependent histone deacetylase HST4 Ecym_4171 [Eremothecium cymbalariae DBVPG|uniref:Deacetylase sirtuin-type domain-containing protein n=1 Tax=Eremothecium cymbalariae (strain CBS 270.75 / DBVPG 7215 / KCTC 17166 / NRRL Y-17582) TaxID=931890 RepID=G8JT95_ERECY|nr:hypothetical protein Ecym_4171 [Eremothecium cymbalariae DBVPG\
MGVGKVLDGGETMQYESPKKHKLPITPPSSVEKKQGGKSVAGESSKDVKPKELLPALKMAGVKLKRKPRLKYRPERNSVFCVDDYLNYPQVCGKKDAEFIKYAFMHCKNIVAITGAGISVAAGIPDFRSSDGLFASLKGQAGGSGKRLFDFNYVHSSEEMNIKFNKMISDMHTKCQVLEPTRFHKLLNILSISGRLRRIYTQNIDCIENKLDGISSLEPEAPSKKTPTTIQLHGSINHMSCTKCRKIYDMNTELFKCHEDDLDRSVIPVCPECEEFEAVRAIAGKRSQGVGLLRPYIVLYNEVHPVGEKVGELIMKDLKLKCDCLLIVGTSLKIPGVKTICKQFCNSVRSRKGIILWINRDMPSQSIQDLLGGVDLFVLGDCQDLCQIIEL